MDKYDCFLEAGGFIDETSDITEEDDVFKEVDLHDIDTDLPDTLEADCSLNRWVSELSISELQDEALPVVNSEGAQLGLGHTEAPDKDCETTERLGPLEQSLKTLPPRYVRGIRRTVSEPTGSLNKSLSEALKDEIGCMIRFRRFTAGYEEFEEEDKPRKNILTMEDIRRRELVRQRNKKHAKASRERFHQLLEDLKERQLDLEAENNSLRADVQNLKSRKEIMLETLRGFVSDDPLSKPVVSSNSPGHGKKHYLSTNRCFSVLTHSPTRKSQQWPNTFPRQKFSVTRKVEDWLQAQATLPSTSKQNPEELLCCPTSSGKRDPVKSKTSGM